MIVEGNHRVDSETIASYFSGTDPASVNTGVKALYATGLFSDIEISHSRGAIVVRVAENNLINRVAFEGNSKVKSDQLQSTIEWKDHGPFNKTIVDADVERIKDLYRRAGEAAATVTYRIVSLPNGRVDVVFKIDEGPKTGVKDIVFVGNHVYSSGKLRDLMQTTEMDWLSFFKSSDVYDPDKIASDLDAIRRFYLKNGYADFHIVGSDARYDPSLKGYVVTMTPSRKARNIHVAAVISISHPGDQRRCAAQLSARLCRRDLQRRHGTEDDRCPDDAGHAAWLRLFPSASPGDRDPVARTIRLAFVMTKKGRVSMWSESIFAAIWRTVDYVIRRESILARVRISSEGCDRSRNTG